MWWNGRHRGLKIPCRNKRAGSSPAIRTALNLNRFKVFYLQKKSAFFGRLWFILWFTLLFSVLR